MSICTKRFESCEDIIDIMEKGRPLNDNFRAEAL